MTMPTVRLLSVGAQLPSRCVSNEALCNTLRERGVESSDEWISTRTGIHQRYFVDPSRGETTTSLATDAARVALERAGVSPDDVDLIIVATTTPDRVFPSTACQVQHLLQAKKAAAFDVQAVCAGFAYALNVATSMLKTMPYRHAVVIGAECMSRILDWQDRGTCVLFGDGAGAVVLRREEEPSLVNGLPQGVLSGALLSDGSLGVEVLGLDTRVEDGHAVGDPFLRMDGQTVFKAAVSGLTDSAQQVLAEAGLTAQDVDVYIPHQANLRIMTMVAKRLGIPMENMVTSVHDHGNTSAASVPLGLAVAYEEGRLKPGSVVLLQGIGAGMAWGATLLRF